MIMDYKTRGNHKHCNVSGQLHQSLPPLHYCELQLHVCVPADCSAPRSFQAHMDLCVVAFLSHRSAMWHCDLKTRTHAHGLPQYSKAANTSIYRQPRESCKQSWCQARMCIVIRAGFHHHRSHQLSNQRGTSGFKILHRKDRIWTFCWTDPDNDDKIQLNNCDSDKEASTFIAETKAKITY